MSDRGVFVLLVSLIPPAHAAEDVCCNITHISGRLREWKFQGTSLSCCRRRVQCCPESSFGTPMLQVATIFTDWADFSHNIQALAPLKFRSPDEMMVKNLLLVQKTTEGSDSMKKAPMRSRRDSSC